MSNPSLKKGSLLFVFLVSIVFSVQAQSNWNVDTIQVRESYDNVLIKKLNSDKNSSTFLIFIKKEVKLHKHISHSETIYVVEGSGDMVLGDKKIAIKKGDVIFIPENTPHSVFVTSEKPLKVISNQAPEFDGKDRIFIE
jgi:mannose-6-phosphate isomerase-like protein (cupin superfamily)